jgi:hypothetical protein
MSNNFKIVISATDKATSSIRKVNNSISKISRPLVDVQRSARALGTELNRNPAVKTLGKITNAAASAVAGMAKLAIPMAAITGAVSIAGIVRLGTEWGRLGFEIGKTSALFDVSSSSLQSMRGAAELAGVSSEALTSGLGSLRQTLQDAKWGRNQPVMGLMDRLNIGFHKTANGSVDAVRGLKDVADAIAAQKDVGAKHTIAQAFGVADLLPLLMKGRKGIEELEAQVGRFGGVRSNAAIKAAEEFGRKLIEMKAAANGLKIEIGSALMPAMKPLVEQFTNWVALNREPIGAKIGEWAKKIGDYFGNLDFDAATKRIEKLAGTIVKVIEKVGELIEKFDRLNDPSKYVFGGIPRMLFDMMSPGGEPGKRSSGGAVTGPAAPAPANAPLGIRNNNPGNLRQWGSMPKVGGFAQFPDATSGLAAMAKQLQLYGSRGINTLKGVISTWAPASENDTNSYINSIVKKTGFAPDQKLNLNDSKTLAPLISSMIQHENGQNPYSKETIEAAIATTVTVEFKNAPAGTSATARTKNGTDVPVRINHSLPTLAAG